MASDLWIHPVPAQPDDFLQLHYDNQYGYPEGAHTSIYQHPWSQHDYMGLAAEIEITRADDDGYRVRLIVYSWNAMAPGFNPGVFELFNGCSCTAWDTHETFGRFSDAEAFAQFAWSRWRATGAGGSTGMKWRDDLDSRLNPVPLEPALA